MKKEEIKEEEKMKRSQIRLARQIKETRKGKDGSS